MRVVEELGRGASRSRAIGRRPSFQRPQQPAGGSIDPRGWAWRELACSDGHDRDALAYQPCPKL